MSDQRLFTPGSFVTLPSQRRQPQQQLQQSRRPTSVRIDPAVSSNNNFVQVPTELSPRRSMWVFNERTDGDDNSGRLKLEENTITTRLAQERNRRPPAPSGVFVYDFANIHREEIEAAAQHRREMLLQDRKMRRDDESFRSQKSLAKVPSMENKVADSVWIRMQNQASILGRNNCSFRGGPTGNDDDGDVDDYYTPKGDSSGDEARAAERSFRGSKKSSMSSGGTFGHRPTFVMDLPPRPDIAAAMRLGMISENSLSHGTREVVLDTSNDVFRSGGGSADIRNQLGGTSSGSMPATSFGGTNQVVSWAVDPRKEIPFTLLLMRGLDVDRHRDVFDHHLVPQLLQESSVLQQGTYLTLFPSGTQLGGVAHERFFSMNMMPTKRYPQPMLCWKQYEGSRTLFDRIPLASLVDVTFDAFSSANFDNFHARAATDASRYDGAQLRDYYDQLVKQKWRQRRAMARMVKRTTPGISEVKHKRVSSFGSANTSMDGLGTNGRRFRPGKRLQSLFSAFRSPGQWLAERVARKRDKKLLASQGDTSRRGSAASPKASTTPKPTDDSDSDDSVTSNESELDEIREELMPTLTETFPWLVGSAVTSGKTCFLPVQCAFTMWFYNPSSGSSTAVDVCASSYRLAALWVRVLRGVIAINSVSAAQASGEFVDGPDASAQIGAAETPEKQTAERSRLGRSSVERQRRQEQPSFFDTFQ